MAATATTRRVTNIAAVTVTTAVVALNVYLLTTLCASGW
jgi:hypothetical protein